MLLFPQFFFSISMYRHTIFMFNSALQVLSFLSYRTPHLYLKK